jgi:uncharacterized membrane protein YhaH (DUF805 family)
MLATLFGFQGRLGRLPYLGWSVAAMFLLIAVVAFFLIVGIGLAGATSAYGAGPKILGGLMALTSMVVGAWTTLALSAKRIRDTGFAPLPVIIGFVLLSLVDALILTRLTGVRFFWPFAQYTPLGGLAGIAGTVFLFCWPSAPARSPDAAGAREGAGDGLRRASPTGFQRRSSSG